MSTKAKGLIALAVVLVLALGGGYFALKNYYAPGKQMTRIFAAVHKGDAKSLSKLVVATDPTVKVDEASVQPLATYFKKNSGGADQFVDDLRYRSRTNFGHFTLQQSGKYFLLFPKYVLRTDERLGIQLTASRGGVTIKQGNKTLIKTTADHSEKALTSLLPGEYQFTGNTKLNGKKLSAKKSVYIGEETGTTSVPFNFVSLTLTVTSQLNGGTLYDTNGTKYGKIKDNKLKIGPVGYMSGTKFYVQKKFSDGTARSRQYDPANYFADSDSSWHDKVNLSAKGTMTKNDAANVLSNILYNVYNGYSSGTFEDDDDFSGSPDKNSAYLFYKAVADKYAKRDDVMSVDWNAHVRSVTQTGVKTWAVNYDLTYDVNYEDDRDERIQTFNDTGTMVEEGGHYKMAATEGKFPAVYDNNANTGKAATGDPSRADTGSDDYY